MNDVLHAFLREIVPSLGEAGVVRLVSTDGRWLTAEAALHDDKRTLSALRTALTQPYPTRETQARTDAAPDSIPSAHEQAARAYLPSAGTFVPTFILTVPLVAGGHRIGVLDVARGPAGPAYNPAEQHLLNSLAPRAATVIAHAQRHAAALESIRTRDEVLSTISHDLRGPLTVIDATAQLLDIDVPEGVPAQRLTRRILDASHRMARDIAGLLEVAQLQMGKPLALNTTSLDLVALVNRTVADVRETAPHHTFVVETRLTDLVGTWDATRLRHTLDNLLSNAVKYSPRESTVTVTLDRTEENGKPWAVITVRDQGIGIPAADVPHIFERFRRARNVQWVSGSGIGLSVVADIVRQHGGEVSVSSQEHQGTTFTVQLPLSAEQRDVSAAA
jgi:signal transduction histidine kinase